MGAWVWKKLFYGGKKTAFATQLEQLISFVQDVNIPSSVQEILDAFDNDIKFHKNVGNDDFQFAYRRLSAKTQEVLKDLMIAFYEKLLRSGIEPVVHGRQEKLNRDGFVNAFWKTNVEMEVCPACDAAREDVDLEIEKHFEDADHYLPKSIYPFLSIHPANLVPLCLACNRTFKGNRDPIDDHDVAPMSNSFFPYTMAAIGAVNTQVKRDAIGIAHINIQEHSGLASRRIDNLVRVFSFQSRWPGRLKYQISTVSDEVATWGRRFKRRQIRLDEQLLREELEDMLDRKSEELGKRHNSLLIAGYLSFVLEDEDEFQGLYAKFSS